MLKLLIIGGDSFLGKNFIKHQGLSFDIHVVSRVATGYKQECVCADLFSLKKEMFSNFDVVIHCAALVHQRKSLPESLYMEVNYELPIFIASLAKDAGVRTFVQISSIAVYGRVEHINGNTPKEPINAYGKSKLAADDALLKMDDNTFRIVIIRPPMIYGSAEAPGNMMRLVQLISKGFPLPFKKLNNLRDFVHIGNLTHIIQLLILSNYHGEILVCDGKGINSSELNYIITDKLNIKNRAFRIPKLGLFILKKIYPGVFEKLFGTLTIDISVLKGELNYTPKYSIEEGLADMCKDIKKQDKAK